MAPTCIACRTWAATIGAGAGPCYRAAKWREGRGAGRTTLTLDIRRVACPVVRIVTGRVALICSCGVTTGAIHRRYNNCIRETTYRKLRITFITYHRYAKFISVGSHVDRTAKINL